MERRGNEIIKNWLQSIALYLIAEHKKNTIYQRRRKSDESSMRKVQQDSSHREGRRRINYPYLLQQVYEKS